MDVPPSPKFQLQEEGPLVDKSVNITAPVQVEVSLTVKFADGGKLGIVQLHPI